MKVYCECESMCVLMLNIPADEYKDAHRQGLVFVSNDCKHGPSKGDQLIEKRKAYSIYKDHNKIVNRRR